jgi:DNA-binding MarR family transcriptional regulator
MTNVERIARRIASDCPGLRLRQAARVVSKIYDDALRPTGIQVSQLPVLVALAIFGERGASMNALADAVVMDRTTLTRSLRPLEQSGYLRVARSPEDARARVVLLTRAGERALEAVFPLWESAAKDVRSRLGAAAASRLQAELERVIAMR